jgi:hypothetical protein
MIIIAIIHDIVVSKSLDKPTMITYQLNEIVYLDYVSPRM